MNMAYCRFQNTLKDLRDCAEHVTDELRSDEERHAREELLEIARQMVEEYDETFDMEEEER